ncbi:MAG: L-2-hydroxyglutarate oxidase [Acidimicrobiia bacterium]
MESYDVCIVGGGLIGLAVGRALTERRPGLAVLIVEKEDRVGAHQSGHNSGVIHSGLYYRPASLKARLAVTGAKALYELCTERGIPHRRSGKLVIASDRSQIPALEELERRGRANGLESLRRLEANEIPDIEPEASGVAALSVPSAGVVDFSRVADELAADLIAQGGTLRLGHAVRRIRSADGVLEIVAGDGSFRSRFLVNCAGLQSDRVAALAGIEPAVRIVPFRGEYYTMAGGPRVNSLIYPVPNPRFPFLGVHFTHRIDGSVELGPNAVVALGREHYRGARPNWADVAETLRYRGFQKLAAANLWAGVRELANSRSRRLYTQLAQKLVPALQSEHLRPGGVGIRAQAVDRAGMLVDDFVIERTANSIHVLNAPSPGATACMVIGRFVAAQFESDV